jgi:hypothetical protein
MAWSYRSDNSDSIYSSGAGPIVVTGARQSAPPAAGAASSAADVSSAQIAQLPVNVYTADGAITVAAQRAIISKTSAAAMTLAAPTAAQAGLTIVLTAGTAFAHVITATGLIDDGVTGGAKNSITLGAFVGATATIYAYNLHWVLQSKTVATVA